MSGLTWESFQSLFTLWSQSLGQLYRHAGKCCVSGGFKCLHIDLTLEVLVFHRSYQTKVSHYHLEEIQIFRDGVISKDSLHFWECISCILCSFARYVHEALFKGTLPYCTQMAPNQVSACVCVLILNDRQEDLLM